MAPLLQASMVPLPPDSTVPLLLANMAHQLAMRSLQHTGLGLTERQECRAGHLCPVIAALHWLLCNTVITLRTPTLAMPSHMSCCSPTLVVCDAQSAGKQAKCYTRQAGLHAARG